MSVIDSARFMTLTAVGLADAIIAVLDAKYYYNFWRPITAIRNGDIDDNPATEREATWQPIAPTPMHPEYPCAHCVQSGTVAGVVKAVLGTTEIPEIAVTSSDGARGDPPMDQHDRLYGRNCKCSHLGGLPLPFLNPRRYADGPPDW